MELGRKDVHGFSRKLSLLQNFLSHLLLLYVDAADLHKKPRTVKLCTEVGNGIYELDAE